MAEEIRVPKGTRTVTVRCKHPAGLLLRVFDLHDVEVPGRDGTKTEKMAHQVGDTVKINGCRIPLDRNGTPKEIDFLIVGGYALTPDVDADFFAKWMSQNKDSDMVKNDLIGYASTEEAAKKEAKDRRKVLSGLEPLVPDTDPRIPRRVDGKAAITSGDAAGV